MHVYMVDMNFHSQKSGTIHFLDLPIAQRFFRMLGHGCGKSVLGRSWKKREHVRKHQKWKEWEWKAFEIWFRIPSFR